MARIFTGDFSTGDASQWYLMQNVTALANTGSYSASWAQYRDLLGTYPLQVLSEDADCGYVARFESRAGDLDGSNERTEVADVARPINVTRWEAFSVKFDATFPLDGASYGWAVTNQWTDASGIGWVISPNHIDGATPSGYWTLNYFNGTSNIRLLDVPLNRGNWIDVKMQVGWYDTGSGFVKVWINGEAKQLRYTTFGNNTPSYTFTGKMVHNNVSGTFQAKQGLYRQGGVSFPTGIIYHANYRSADSEASL